MLYITIFQALVAPIITLSSIHLRIWSNGNSSNLLINNIMLRSSSVTLMELTLKVTSLYTIKNGGTTPDMNYSSIYTQKISGRHIVTLMKRITIFHTLSPLLGSIFISTPQMVTIWIFRDISGYIYSKKIPSNHHQNLSIKSKWQHSLILTTYWISW